MQRAPTSEPYVEDSLKGYPYPREMLLESVTQESLFRNGKQTGRYFCAEVCLGNNFLCRRITQLMNRQPGRRVGLQRVRGRLP